MINKEQFEQNILNTCNTVAEMIHNQDLSITREQCWEMAKTLVFKSYNAVIDYKYEGVK